MPTSIRSNYEGYQELLAVYGQLKDCFFEDIQIDFTKTQWFDANLFALFGAFLYDVKSINTLKFINLSKTLKAVMLRSRFIQKDKTYGVRISD